MESWKQLLNGCMLCVVYVTIQQSACTKLVFKLIFWQLQLCCRNYLCLSSYYRCYGRQEALYKEFVANHFL